MRFKPSHRVFYRGSFLTHGEEYEIEPEDAEMMSKFGTVIEAKPVQTKASAAPEATTVPEVQPEETTVPEVQPEKPKTAAKKTAKKATPKKEPAEYADLLE